MTSKITTIRIPDRILKAMKGLHNRSLGRSLNGFINEALYQHLYTLGKLKLSDEEKELLGVKDYEAVEEK
ncbi:MAG: hypothetical protein O7B30_06025 [Thaumarchaeota archaeon]|nr:hypothetical protein [Nitrososphaerota archaeon]